MASHKTNEQCITWLRSMAADKDSLDGINAELCLNLIESQKSQLNKLGIQFNQVKDSRDAMKRELDELRESITTALDEGLSESQKEYLRQNGIDVFDF